MNIFKFSKSIKQISYYTIPNIFVKQVPMDKPFGIVSFMDLVISKPKYMPRKVRAVMIKED